ncbi:nucleoside phosphorylase domain-containing protein [Melanogaster broomeanus]|nr:nucleoside phosphorylase domain-containing protein [Melanogaster broomeanus]
MKDTLTDANFPKTADGHVYHLGIKYGDVANRIVTVGSMSRAYGIGELLDAYPKPFSLHSERGFLTITGRYHGVPVSIVCIGMGGPNADFFIREVRECIRGDMLVIRLGSCGSLTDLPVGSLVLPKASIAVTRNLDFDFANGDPWSVPYRLSKPISADAELVVTLQRALESTRPVAASNPIATNGVNASTDSFYSSQGRQTAFRDHNSSLIDNLKETIPDITSLEMETYWIFHLAASWSGFSKPSPALELPLATGLVLSIANFPACGKVPTCWTLRLKPTPEQDSVYRPLIRAAALQMVFASRLSQDFITPEQVSELEAWSGRAVLEALGAMNVPDDRLHPHEGSVWDLKGTPLN